MTKRVKPKMIQPFTYSDSTTVEKQSASNSELTVTTWDHIESADEANLSAHRQCGDADAVVSKQHHESPEINRLLTAAAINSRFCQELLRDPAVAIAFGYRNEQFTLTAAEIRILCSIQATSLSEFAGILHKRLLQKSSETEQA